MLKRYSERCNTPDRRNRGLFEDPSGDWTPYAEAAEEIRRLREALEKAEIGLMCCNPLPGYDMATLSIVRAAIGLRSGYGTSKGDTP